MDLQPEELQLLTIPQLLQESISIKKRTPRTFYLITLSPIFPLSFAILAHSLFTQPILAELDSSDPPNSDRSRHDWTVLLTFQFSYLIFLFSFSLLSTAAVVFTVASLYTGKPVSFSSTITDIPKVFKRLMITFLWVALLMFAYNSVFLVFLAILIVALYLNSVGLAIIAGVIISVLYFVVHVYFTALWHLGSVVSVLEPVYGLAAMRKAYELLKGETRMAMVLVFVYLLLCAVIGGAFGGIVIHGGGKFGTLTRTLVGGLLVGLLVMVNLVGLLVQSVFYYVCKSYHHQTIDKTVLYNHLGGYLGEYVPLKSNIQLENLEF
ncbi:hypothetical protein Bca4012_093004 [Brassica carinata]|uniref:BnaC08g09270D protein n=4 Tax=Brassica TaxID=3705 RepID=A0A078FJZ0_BRANA|nr:PREDICTED: uncharacterized protein LOC106325753 [Brassica oleracea var. oleracea]XP_048621541.1 uncharacterized protein LOC106375479 [Brassica napus]KAG2255950.1 hypothetical protein Bca52824_075244 [Brassica carinata]CDY12438.1 BnaC08g09270D [Brassica napus]VDD54936.1 unnamed protein product [Brassica oleracea]